MSSSAFTPTQTQITNNVPTNVPIVEAWQTYTPTVSNIAISSVSGRWRRIGDSMSIQGSFNPSATGNSNPIEFSIPSGLTVDSTKIVQSVGTSLGYFGSGMFFISATDYRPCHVSAQTSTTLAFSDDRTSGLGPINGTDLSSGNTLTFNATIPIAEWAGSGTTTLATRAIEEYASNSGAEGTAANTQYSNSSYFVYGPNGSLIPNVNSVTSNAATEYLCRFQNSILPTDTIILEIQQTGTGAWLPVYAGQSGVGAVTYQRQISSYYGVGFTRVSGSSTDIYVAFGNYGARPGGAGATFSSVGDTWSNFTSYRWRLRKVSGGAQVGYPVSARNIIGDTSGSVVPTGMIGERISGTIATGTNVRGAIGNVSSITLTPGTYLVFRKLTVGTTGQDGTTNLNLSAEIVAGSNSTLPGGETYASFDYSSFSAGQQAPRWIMSGSYINVTSTAIYYFNARTLFGGTLTTATISAESYFYAVRIA